MSKLRVLVAEDHEEVRRALLRFLRREFKVVGVVADGFELIDAAIALNPDVIVSDICMPRLTGPEAMNTLRAKGCMTPFVFISAGENVLGPRATFVSKSAIGDLVPAILAAIHRRRPNL